MKILHVVTLFFTLGLALAREFFTQAGIHADYATIGLFGIALTTLLIFRGIVPLLAIGILAGLISMNDSSLVSLHMDRQILQAAALTIVLFPWIKRFLLDA